MKLLITSDIHINDFRSHNILGDQLFRLHQFDKLADRLVQIIQEEKVQAVCIAGDFLHVASPRPYVVNAAGRFLKKLAKLVPIYVTHGQHDFDSRTIMSEDNSLLSLYNNIDNVHYLHKQNITLGSREVYFQGWTPEQDFSEIIAGQYDVLIGHATIDSAVMNDYGTQASGQKVDSDKFKLCFMGDIHYPQVKDNQIIPGVPIQNNFGDSDKNSVIILETDDLTWKRVATETAQYRFLKFLTTDKIYDDPYFITKPKTVKNLASKENLTKSVDIVQVVDKYVKTSDLVTLHEKVLTHVSKLESDEINLNYCLDHIHVKNFGSIEEASWDFITGLTLIVGNNGSGKSTLVEAIRFALLGSDSPKDLVRSEQTEMSVDLSLRHANVKYRLLKGYAKKAGYIRYFINDVEQQFENQAAAKLKIKKDLSFLELYKHLHRNQQSPYFLGNQSYNERVELISKVVGLSLIDKLKNAAEAIRVPVVTETKANEIEYKALITYLESVKSLNLSEEIENYDDEIKVNQDVNKYLQLLISLEQKITASRNAISKLEYGLRVFSHYDFTALDETFEADTKTNDDRFRELKALISSTELTISKLKSEMSSIQYRMKTSTKSVNELNAKSSQIQKHSCYVCHQEIDRELTTKLLQDLKFQKDILTQEFRNDSINLKDLQNDLDRNTGDQKNLADEFQQIRDEKTKIEAAISDRKALMSAKEKFDTVEESLNLELKNMKFNEDSLQSYKSLLSKKFNIDLIELSSIDSYFKKLQYRSAELQEKKRSQEKLNLIKAEIGNKKFQLESITRKRSDLRQSLLELDKYISLMSSSGDVTRSILTTISDSLSNEKIKVIAYKTLASGETRPDFNLYLNVAGTFRQYDRLSGGQKNVCDIFILKHLIDIAGGAGSLVFDETFSQVDNTNLEYAVDILRQMKVNYTFVISHHENFPHYDNQILTKFDTSTGITTYNLPI